MCCLVGGGRLRSMPIRRPSHALLKQNCTLVSHPCRLIPCGRSPEIFIFSLFGGKSRQVQQVSIKWPAVVCQVVTNEPIDYPLKAFQKPMKRKSSFRCKLAAILCQSLSWSDISSSRLLQHFITRCLWVGARVYLVNKAVPEWVCCFPRQRPIWTAIRSKKEEGGTAEKADGLERGGMMMMISASLSSDTFLSFLQWALFFSSLLKE